MANLAELIEDIGVDAFTDAVRSHPFVSSSANGEIELRIQKTGDIIPQSVLKRYGSRPPPNGKRSWNFPIGGKKPANSFVNPRRSGTRRMTQWTRYGRLRMQKFETLNAPATIDIFLKDIGGSSA